MKVLLAMLVMILFSACSMQEEIASSDSFGDSIVLERSGMYTLPEFGNQIYTLTQSNLNVKVYHYDGTLTKEVNFTLHPGITYKYFKTFEELDFTSLQDNYRSTIPVADVGQGVITYKNHSILIAPYISKGNPSEVSEIIETLGELMGEVNMSEVFVMPSNSDEEVSAIIYTYTGAQCVQEPWEQWYAQGETQYVQEPTQEQLIRDYYASQGIEIELVEKIESDMMQCQACEVCSKGYSFKIQIFGVSEVLENDDWVIQK